MDFGRLGRGIGAAIALSLVLLVALPPTPASAQAVPPNDTIANAQATSAGDLLVVDTRGATTESGEPVPSCAPPGDPPIHRTVWYAVAAHGTTLRFSAFGRSTSFRPLLALYQRDAAGVMTQVACTALGELTATVVDGRSYLLQVGGGSSYGDDDSGQVSLLIGPVVGSISTGGGGGGGGSVLCTPRPRVVVQVTQAGAGRLTVTIQTNTNSGSAPNALQEVRITSTTNAVVDVPNGPQGASGVVVLPLAPGALTSQFTLRRSAVGAFKANLTVTDGCGAWPTFVGGGTGVP